MTLTRDFCDLLAKVYETALDEPSHAEMLNALVMDGVAVTFAGCDFEGPTILRDLAGALSGSGGPQTTVIGQRGKLPLLDSVRANGAAMHVLDYEPMWNPANHSVSTVLPALLGLVEALPDLPGPTQAPDGRAFLSAFAAGIEAQTRLRRASNQFEPGDLVFHPPGVVGPIGSAVACGLLMGLDTEHLVHAVGIAASRAGSVLVNAGSMTKALHCGAAAADGLEAALLASKGFRSDPDALDGPRGFLRAFFGEGADPAPLLADAPLSVVNPGPAFKFYPSQYGTHFVIDAALKVHRALPPGSRIETVEIVCPVMPYVNRPAPPTGLAGKFSFQYVSSAALLDGAVNLATFTDKRRHAADMNAFLPRVTITPKPEREGRFDRMRVDVIAVTDDGTRVEGICDGPPGIWGNPAPIADVRRKALECLTSSEKLAPEALLDSLGSIETMTREGVMDLVAHLAADPA